MLKKRKPVYIRKASSVNALSVFERKRTEARVGSVSTLLPAGTSNPLGEVVA